MKEFTCAYCHGTFNQVWSDEEAAAEARARFGMDPTTAHMAVVCDDCYEMMTSGLSPEEWRAAQETS